MNASPILPTQIETVAELRDLYRAAEARAARLRLLSEAGGELAGADAGSIAGVLESCARRLAHFLGCPAGAIALGPAGEGLAILPPGQANLPIARLQISGFRSVEDIPDREERDAVRMYLQLLGATIDRIAREGERAQLLDRLQERERRLEELVSRIFTAQEEERRRVSRELHDGVAQKATALFRLLESGAAAQGEGLVPGDGARLAGIARELVQELRAVIGGLRPTILDDLGLPAALRSLVEGLRADGFEVAETIDSAQHHWPATMETAFYRVAQEAVANIRKHAGGPCRVEVALRTEGAPAAWRLRIRDFGRGLAARVDPAGLAGDGQHIGVAVMRERMAALGGRLEWISPPEGGVCVEASVVREP